MTTVPQVKTKGQIKTIKDTAASQPTQRPGNLDAHDLITKMLEYESAAARESVDLTSGRFSMLTTSERQYYRAELIADYIRLSAGNMGNSQGYFDASLSAYCSKICDMKVPSHEIIGTYLAAVDLADKEENLQDVIGLKDAVKRTMMIVLQACVAEMAHRTQMAT